MANGGTSPKKTAFDERVKCMKGRDICCGQYLYYVEIVAEDGKEVHAFMPERTYESMCKYIRGYGDELPTLYSFYFGLNRPIDDEILRNSGCKLHESYSLNCKNRTIIQHEWWDKKTNSYESKDINLYEDSRLIVEGYPSSYDYFFQITDADAFCAFLKKVRDSNDRFTMYTSKTVTRYIDF